MLVGRTRLAADLVPLGLRPGTVALVHCRMSALGRVIGGAETVIRALIDAVGPEGTLFAYVGWQDGPPDDLELLAPGDRELVRAEQPVYDPAVGRARRDHGRVAEAIRTRPAVVHSGHPEAGVAALGHAAADVALPYDPIAGGVDYVEHFARAALERGAGRSGPLGAGTGHVFDARGLTEATVELIEATFGAGG
ncbi:MAG: AAC(3) family N-acetyltransferase [Gaiella sp.]|nr:AAC(3) family N-acetyltransferase [Gaiella sp.]